MGASTTSGEIFAHGPGRHRIVGGLGKDTLRLDWSGLKIGVKGSAGVASVTGHEGQFSWRDDLGPLKFGGRWTETAAEASFSPRDTGDPFQFDGALWLSNGYHLGNGSSRDLWRSGDGGATWTLVNGQTPYDAYSRIEVLDGYMYAIRDSVWRSHDGVAWEQVAEKTPFDEGQGLFEMRATVFNGRLWVIAPTAAWSSADGVTWTKEADLPFDARLNFALTVFDGKLVLAGGFSVIPNDPPEAGYPNFTSYNDVWTSVDGRTWEPATLSAEWDARQWLHMEEVDGLLYLFGGYSNREARNLNDMWVSKDGITWTEVQLDEVWSGRHWSSVYVVDNRIILAGGNDSVPGYSRLRNDVWTYSDDGQLSSASFSGIDRFELLLGEGANDVQLGAGADLVVGGLSDHILRGGAGDDEISGAGGADQLFGEDGDDRVEGGAGDDLLEGGAGADILEGGEGADRLSGDDGNDRLYGNEGNDRVEGGAGDDMLDGGDGADRLVGGLGVDRLIGGGLDEDRFQAAKLWLSAESGAVAWYIADFDGDGRDDLFRYLPSVSGADMFLSSGTGFDAAGSWTLAGSGSRRWFLGDFNGDGRDDILRYIPKVTGAEILLSTGSSFALSGSWTSAGFGNEGWSIGDFDGDGRDDLLRYSVADRTTQVLLSTGSAFARPTTWAVSDSGRSGWLIGDFNRDGRDDLLRRSAENDAEVLLSNGTGFDGAQTWFRSAAPGEWRIGDVNRDGADDVLLMSQSGVQAMLSTGSRFRVAFEMTKESAGQGGWFLGDFDGDGGTDLLRQTSNGTVESLLVGPTSNDVFEFELGFGHDVIEDFGRTDLIRFGHGFFDDFEQVRAAAQTVEAGVLIAVDQENSLLLSGIELASLTADHFIFG